MVEVKNLSKTFKTRKKGFFGKGNIIHAVDNVSFSIEKGKTLGLVGESGSGKTTTARAMMRLIEPDSGTVYINNTDLRDLGKEELRAFRKNIQLVFQDPYSSLNPRMRIGKIIAEPIKVHTNLKKKEIQQKLIEIISLVGLEEAHLDRYPHEFSGGQRQRIGIARAIALNPDVIILDEPVSALDVSIQGQILNLLKDLQKKLEMSYLFVAHDLAVVEHMSDTICVMYLGRIVEENTRDNLYKNPLHPYTKSLLSSIPEVRPEKHGFTPLEGEIPSPENPPTGCHFHPRCPKAMDICKIKYPHTAKSETGSVSCHLFK